tara:strand:+ start:8563 stop:8874 length:312 start_codon:yes stop_codon:yes gene_type:complete
MTRYSLECPLIDLQIITTNRLMRIQRNLEFLADDERFTANMVTRSLAEGELLLAEALLPTLTVSERRPATIDILVGAINETAEVLSKKYEGLLGEPFQYTPLQ